VNEEAVAHWGGGGGGFAPNKKKKRKTKKGELKNYLFSLKNKFFKEIF